MHDCMMSTGENVTDADVEIDVETEIDPLQVTVNINFTARQWQMFAPDGMKSARARNQPEQMLSFLPRTEWRVSLHLNFYFILVYRKNKSFVCILVSECV